MTIYLIPIFCFGLVITGIIFMGVQQASDLAKYQNSQRSESESAGAETKTLAAGQDSVPLAPLAGTHHS